MKIKSLVNFAKKGPKFPQLKVRTQIQHVNYYNVDLGETSRVLTPILYIIWGGRSCYCFQVLILDDYSF